MGPPAKGLHHGGRMLRHLSGLLRPMSRVMVPIHIGQASGSPETGDQAEPVSFGSVPSVATRHSSAWRVRQRLVADHVERAGSLV